MSILANAPEFLVTIATQAPSTVVPIILITFIAFNGIALGIGYAFQHIPKYLSEIVYYLCSLLVSVLTLLPNIILSACKREQIKNPFILPLADSVNGDNQKVYNLTRKFLSAKKNTDGSGGDVA